MPQNYFGRVVLILLITFLALLELLPPGSLFDASVPWSQKLNLKPGIDMVGGTKLIYEIKAPDGEELPTGDLASQVMEALKKRVDPDGVRNLVWRPQGGNRLEIQMPLSKTADDSQAIRDAYSQAQAQLNATNVRRSDVIRAVERLSGDARRERFEQLAMGSDKRAELLGAMASAYDRVQEAHKTRDLEKQAKAELEYDALKARIEETNLGSADLDAILEGGSDQTRQERLDALKQKFEGFAVRLASIDAYVKAWEHYSGIKGQLDSAGELKRLLRGSGVLEFHILVEGPELNAPQVAEMAERLAPGGKGVTPQAGDTMRWYEVDRPQDVAGMQGQVLLQDYNDRLYVLGWTTPDKSMVNRAGEPQWGLERAYRAQTQLGTTAVGFTFDSRGASRFGEMTSNNLKRLMAVMLDDKVISVATIQDAISKTGIISRQSGYSKDEFNYLVNTLNAGSLPARLADEPISEQTVGPQLGEDNLRLGLYTCYFGMVIVAIFLIGYYYLSGVVAMVAVVLNLILILGAMAAVEATFTLPSVAGIVLTIGCAVDANVLIFERLREEQVRGMGLKMALRNAYDRAFSAIVDANVTTAITAAVLYWAGSEEVKGFGLTLLLGMVSSMFTALFVTRTIFGLLIDKGGIKTLGSIPLTFPKWDRVLNPNINWMGFARWAYTGSLAFIVIGSVLFVAKWNAGEMLDIEFASGTSVQFELKQPADIAEVRRLIDAYAEKNPKQVPAPQVVSIGTDKLTYEIISPNPVGKDIRDAVIASLGDKLKIERESRFDDVGLDYTQAQRDNVLSPITGDEISLAGNVTVDSAGHEGGVAIVLRNIDPMLTVQQIESRIERQRLQPQPGGRMLPYRDMDIHVAEQGPDGLVKSAVLLVSDPNYPFDKDPGKWTDELAAPTWQLVNEAINNPAQLQKVTNFDAQVAGAAQLRALVALTISAIVILIYIWFRFGDLKFGSAGTVATMHDIFFVIAAIGFSHYVAATAIGDWLLVEPFRINLTMVAAILTVMGYSMNDTVVVFDRIRENRGKFGSVTPKVINDSINQTLSRTLLTGGTTIVTILVMYAFGGTGIHGFTFAMLVGIIIGTYSSIAIASPLLLFRSKSAKTAITSRASKKAAPAN